MEREDKFPINVKVGVKPVYGAMIHSDDQEGPCRIGTPEELSPEAERINAQKSLGEFTSFARSLGPEARVLDTEYIEYGEAFTVSPEAFKDIEKELEDIDLFLLSYRVPGIERYGKPIAMVGRGITNVDIAAYLRNQKLEGYAPLDRPELNRLVSSLRVRKALSITRVLVVYKEGMVSGSSLKHPAGVYSSIGDLNLLKSNLGVDFSVITFEDFFQEMNRVEHEEQDKAASMARDLIENAGEVLMEKDDIIKSIIPYLAAKHLLQKHQCNAFTIPCFTLCTSKLPAKKRFTPCLTHTLLKDQGIPSSCEGDLNALMAMIVLMNCARKSAFMGNPILKDKGGSILQVTHDVPGLKMKGLKEPDLPFNIRPFTKGKWGVTIRYDFSRDKVREVTLARFNPKGTRVLATKGQIIDGGGFDSIGCSLSVSIEIPDAEKFIHRQVDYGHHLAMVYGDYTTELAEVSQISKYDLELI